MTDFQTWVKTEKHDSKKVAWKFFYLMQNFEDNCPISKAKNNFIYQGWGGICLGKFLVRQGESKSAVVFLATIPPITVRGKPTSK